MPIRWSALKVSEAASMIEDFVNQAAEPLEQARIAASEARKIDNLPEYVDQYFMRLLGEIERAIGGSQLEPVGRLKAAIEAIRKAIPKQATEGEQASLKSGRTLSML